jgi:hypothetical protein
MNDTAIWLATGLIAAAIVVTILIVRASDVLVY